MKKTFLGPIAILFLFVSCGNPADSLSDVAVYDNSLRAQFQGRFDHIDWTQELEPNLVSERKDLNREVFSQWSLANPAAASVVEVPDEDRIYPSIPGLGSIDIRGIPVGLRSVVDSFCRDFVALSQNRTDARLYSDLALKMRPGRSYMLSVCLYDTASYPAAQKFFLGAPRAQGEYWEIPVLFVAEEGSWLMGVFAARTAEGWQIEQIRYGDFAYE